MDKAHVQQVIICSKARRGKGTIGSPIRVITEVLDFDGNIIAEHDPNSFRIEHVRQFIYSNFNIEEKELDEKLKRLTH